MTESTSVRFAYLLSSSSYNPPKPRYYDPPSPPRKRSNSHSFDTHSETLEDPIVTPTDSDAERDYRSGCRGVSWNRRMKSWLAFWTENKTRRSKTFNAKVLGFAAARDAAIEFLQNKRAALQAQAEASLFQQQQQLKEHFVTAASFVAAYQEDAFCQTEGLWSLEDDF